ncbi:MAG: hypothetical protein ACP5RS_06700 [Thermoplasmata archaeon]
MVQINQFLITNYIYKLFYFIIVKISIDIQINKFVYLLDIKAGDKTGSKKGNRKKFGSSILIRIEDSELEDIDRILSHPAFEKFNTRTDLVRHIIEKYIKKVHQIESGNYREISVQLNVDTYNILKEISSTTGEKINEIATRILNDPVILKNEINKHIEAYDTSKKLEDYRNKRNEHIVANSNSNFTMEDYDL